MSRPSVFTSLTYLWQSLLLLTGTAHGHGRLTCAYQDTNHPKENSTRLCSDDSYGCYSLWSTKVVDGYRNISIVKQGCWQQSGSTCSQNSKCIQQSHLPSSKSKVNITGFCCCYKSLCNRNIVEVMFNDTVSDVDDNHVEEKINGWPSYRPVHMMTIIGIISGVIALILVGVGWHFKGGVRRFQSGTTTTDNGNEGHFSSIDLSTLNFLEVIGTGRYGQVWKATLNDWEVAVKLFRPENRQLYWMSEKEVYSLPGFEHPNILKFLGADERMKETCVEYLLVTEYHSKGSLTNFLRHNTVNWESMCRLGHSISSGLAFIHGETTPIYNLTNQRPALAHRDLSSKNILVKEDGSCCISDFGFALRISGVGAQRLREDLGSAITEVGTPRYMAPEVMDGAVNLHDFEAALKQVDVYAMGLIMWEISMRCTDIFGRSPVPEYKLPYENELQGDFSFENMQAYVSRKKGRPHFPDAWKQNHLGIRHLKDTIEDCWDQDAEARLTALCVQERWLELMGTSHDWHQDLHQSQTSTILHPMKNFESHLEHPNRRKQNITVNATSPTSASMGSTTTTTLSSGSSSHEAIV